MRYLRAATLILATLILLQGCTTLEDAKRARGEGVKRIYQVNAQTAWDASVMAIMKLNLEISEHDRLNGYILAKRGVTAFSHGENVAVFFRAISSANTEIEVVSKRAIQTNVFAPDWTETIHNEISRLLSD